jgi:predicted dithiol-disulfide oxidoreductase (DUF899 family)
LDEHAVVSPEEWVIARKALLEREKELARLREELAQQRRDLPWEEVTKEYFFDGPDGTRSLPQLFDGRSQLIVYHFMFPPEWDEGCPHCSFGADSFNGTTVHLNARDVTMVAISRAPQPKLAAYAIRMGWAFPWFSSGGTDFDHDFPDREGISVFYAGQGGHVFHTYSTYARGIDMMNTAYQYLDLVPKGRDEAGHDDPQYRVRRHDEYQS